MGYEKWRTIKGYEDWYSVSDTGKVRRDKGGQNRTYAGRLLKPFKNPKGYLVVDLHKHNKGEKFLVHQLVAYTFLGPCPEGKEINHKDFNRANPALSNLEYVTRSENTLHSYKHNRGPDNSGSKSGMAKLTEYEVKKIRNIYETKDITTRRLAEVFNVHQSTISDIIRKETWRYV